MFISAGSLFQSVNLYKFPQARECTEEDNELVTGTPLVG